MLHTLYGKSLHFIVLSESQNIALIYHTELAILGSSFNKVVVVAEFVTMMTSKWGVVNGLSAIRPAFLLSILTLQWIGMRVVKTQTLKWALMFQWLW